MVIAILIALGVSAGAILVLLLGAMLVKRFKTITSPAVFKVSVRTSEGQLPDVRSTWTKCYGAWVTTVFTSRKGLGLSIADVLPMASLDEARQATAVDDLKSLGEDAIIASFTTTTGARIELAMRAEDRSVALAPWSASPMVAATSSTPSNSARAG